MRRSALVVAPHPDDEVLACGGTILAKHALGARVGIVHVSDGSASHRQFMEPELLAGRRREEARSAASRLEVDEQDLFFLDQPDGELGRRQDSVRDGLAALIREFRPEQVFVPYHADGVSDHEAAARAAYAALHAEGMGIEVLEYPVWFWHHWPWTPGREGLRFPSWLRRLRQSWRHLHAFENDFDLRVDVSAHLEAKRHALDAHRSQMMKEPGCPEWPTLSQVGGGTWLECFFRPVEVFRLGVAPESREA